ncbi:MAG: hypothetical protein M1503_00580 [Thaumarchaeota archaeon]|nr:hypothetical protein [Nitrososphaerota archaeon]MCL5316748.1 hypothetical protein [Nitrososphaerota archaeon]
MLRKTRSANIVEALVIIAVLTSSLFAIQVQGQGQGSQTVSADQARAVCDKLCMLWDDQAYYTQLVLIKFQANATADLDVSYSRLLKNAELIGNASQSIIGQARSANLTELLKIHDQIYSQILEQVRLNDTQALSNSTTVWYQNVAEIAALLNTTVPCGKPSSVNVLDNLKMYLNFTLLEVKDYMRGNYSNSIEDFDQAKLALHQMLSKICVTCTEVTTTTVTVTSSGKTTKTITETETHTKTKTVTEPSIITTTVTETVTHNVTTTVTSKETVISTTTVTTTVTTTTTKTITIVG